MAPACSARDRVELAACKARRAYPDVRQEEDASMCEASDTP